MVWSTFIRFKILVGETNGSESFLGVVFDNFEQVLLHAVIQFLRLSVLVEPLVAVTQNDFRSTLHVNALIIRVVVIVNVFEDRRHLLALGSKLETRVTFIQVLTPMFVDVFSQTVDKQ